MKKTLLTATMLVGLCSTTADAAERLKVYDIHNFVSSLNAAVNTPNINNGRASLENLISNRAVFEDNVNQHQYYNRGLVGYDYSYYGYGYRYPYANNAYNYNNVGFNSSDKWEKISALRTKKRTIPGYKGMFTISNTKISPIGDSAVVDVEFKEQSVAYTPGYYTRSYYGQHVALNTHSKCKMNLGKVNNTVYMTRLYCNTSTNLPF